MFRIFFKNISCDLLIKYAWQLQIISSLWDGTVSHSSLDLEPWHRTGPWAELNSSLSAVHCLRLITSFINWRFEWDDQHDFFSQREPHGEYELRTQYLLYWVVVIVGLCKNHGNTQHLRQSKTSSVTELCMGRARILNLGIKKDLERWDLGFKW